MQAEAEVEAALAEDDSEDKEGDEEGMNDEEGKEGDEEGKNDEEGKESGEEDMEDDEAGTHSTT